MLHFVTGNMFDRVVDVRVNTVNCVGVMGKGVAFAFKKLYPAMFVDYRQACRRGDVQPGKLHVWRCGPSSLEVPNSRVTTIVNFPTKRDWREDSRYEDVEDGLKALRSFLMSLTAGEHVTVPALGCGHGGLDWERVKGMITRWLTGLHVEIWVYSPEDSRR